MALYPLISMKTPKLKIWSAKGIKKDKLELNKSPKNIKSSIMNINGFEYTQEEVLEALREKGYLILPFRTYTETHIHGSGFTKDWYDTKCAVKGADLPSDENVWENVAVKEFTKSFTKLKLQ